MDCLTNVLSKFLDLDLLRILAVMAGQRAHRMHYNILICVPKITEGFMGLERHEGE